MILKEENKKKCIWQLSIILCFVNFSLVMDQLKQRIKAVDSTLLSLEQVYTILSHVSM